MRNRNRGFRTALIVLFLVSLDPTCISLAQEADKSVPEKKEPFSLTITGDIDPDLAPVVGQLTEVFYQSYPKMVAQFENPKKPAERHVRLTFERGMKIPAFCSGSKITISVEWMQKHPDDLGVIVHELTHVIQAYPRGTPGWFTEGFADYVRHLYSPKADTKWQLPLQLTKRQHYTDGYRVSARFLLFVESQHPGVVEKIHRRIQNREFKSDDFNTMTGESLDDLWKKCLQADVEKP